MFAWFLKWRIALLTILGYLAAGAVAYVTGRASWGHIVHVGHMVGEPSAAWLPVAVDGMVIAGVVMSGVDRIRGFRSRAWATAAIWLGSILTLAFNVISAIERGPYAMGVAVIYAVTFVFTVETMTHPSKRLLAALAAPVAVPVPAEVPAVTPPVQAPAKGKPGPKPRKGVAGVKPRQGPPRRRAFAGYPGTPAPSLDRARVTVADELPPSVDVAHEPVGLFREPVAEAL